jgi:hypothetical protein
MNVNTLKPARLLFAMSSALLVVGAHSAHAELTTTSGAVCRAFNAGQVGDILYTSSGATNFNSGAARSIICDIPRGSTEQSLYFAAGDNTSGASTSVTFQTFDCSGGFLGSASTSSSAAHYLLSKNFSGINPPFCAIANVLVSLPANLKGVFRGVEAECGSSPC